MTPRPIRLYRFQRRAGRLNFGDDMSAALLEAASGRRVTCVGPARAEVIGLGSILHRFCTPLASLRARSMQAFQLRKDLPAIWGSGFSKIPTLLDAHGVLPLVLRGPKTAELLGVSGVPFGDPGLLVAQVFPAAREKTHAVGIVPHYTDKGAPSLGRLLETFPRSCLIDVEKPYAEVLKQISSCEVIAASSLHGLISADSYGVPALRVSFRSHSEVGDFKFEDYALSVGRTGLPAVDAGTLSMADFPAAPIPRDVIEGLCSGLCTAAAGLPS